MGTALAVVKPKEPTINIHKVLYGPIKIIGKDSYRILCIVEAGGEPYIDSIVSEDDEALWAIIRKTKGANLKGVPLGSVVNKPLFSLKLKDYDA